MDRELLIEIGCEEIPASWLPDLTSQLARKLEAVWEKCVGTPVSVGQA